MKALKVICLCIVNASCIFQAAGQITPALKFEDGQVWVTGLGSETIVISKEQWTEIFRVYTQDAFVRRLDQPVAGTYSWHGASICFKPDFSFAAGGNYHAVFSYENTRIELSFSLPEEKPTSTFIEAVHPQAEVLPENMLRMYISFSAPMTPGEVYDHIRLLSEDGKPVEKSFLIIDQELWDAERKRFTLLFDPGRVKRGIQSNVELGSPLQAGNKYRLVIDSAWRDAHGNFITGFQKNFRVARAERTKLSTSHWKIMAPTAGTHDDLSIEFDRPVDYALALKCITIKAASNIVSGRITLTGSTRWRFTPDQPWTEDQYHIEVFPLMEDVSGNNFNNAFDIDLSKESRVNSSEPVRCPFSIRPLLK